MSIRSSSVGVSVSGTIGQSSEKTLIIKGKRQSRRRILAENGKMEAGSDASEQLFGLRRVESFLLPTELADEFEALGGAAWLALILRGQGSASSCDHGPKPVEAPVSDGPQQLPAKGERASAESGRSGRRRGDHPELPPVSRESTSSPRVELTPCRRDQMSD